MTANVWVRLFFAIFVGTPFVSSIALGLPNILFYFGLLTVMAPKG